MHLVEELHDRTPERHICHVAHRLDLAAFGDLVGVRIRTAAGIAEVSITALANPARKPVNLFVHAMEECWGWLEAVDEYEPPRAELCPDNTGGGVLCLRDAIAVATRPSAAPLPLADLAGFQGSVAGLLIQDPASARRGKTTRRTVEALAEVTTSLTSLSVDQATLTAACELVTGPSAGRRNLGRISGPVASLAGETPIHPDLGSGRRISRHGCAAGP